ncbi:MAG: aldose 1-epimerase, partial [Planctomycetota bacterium]
SSVTGVFRIGIEAPERRSCWPADAEIQIRYTVNGTSLLSEIRVTNPDDLPLPWGFGTHAYFNVPFLAGTEREDYTIMVPSETVVELLDSLPTGAVVAVPSEKSLRAGRSFARLRADDVYSQLIPEEDSIRCRIDHEMSGICLEQRCSLDFREMVVFTPWWSSSICMEPYTCMTNAINLQQRAINAGLRTLLPGEQWTGCIDLHVSRRRD